MPHALTLDRRLATLVFASFFAIGLQDQSFSAGIYWSSLGDQRIGRANLDGSEVDVDYIDAPGQWTPVGVAVLIPEPTISASFGSALFALTVFLRRR